MSKADAIDALIQCDRWDSTLPKRLEAIVILPQQEANRLGMNANNIGFRSFGAWDKEKAMAHDFWRKSISECKFFVAKMFTSSTRGDKDYRFVLCSSADDLAYEMAERCSSTNLLGIFQFVGDELVEVKGINRSLDNIFAATQELRKAVDNKFNACHAQLVILANSAFRDISEAKQRIVGKLIATATDPPPEKPGADGHNKQKEESNGS